MVVSFDCLGDWWLSFSFHRDYMSSLLKFLQIEGLVILEEERERFLQQLHLHEGKHTVHKN